MRYTVLAEWTKIRTLPATWWTLSLTLLLGAGLGSAFGLVFQDNFASLPAEQQERFDPLFATFYSLTFAQLPLVVFGVLLVSAEYSSGTVRASLLAMPRRGVWYAGKLLTGALPILATSMLTVLATFVAAQATLGDLGTTIDADGVPAAIAGGCGYLTLIALFATGVATMLRNSIGSLAILLPLLFLGSQGLGNVPALREIWQYLPDQAGAVLMHLTVPGDPQFGRDYGPWTAVAILVAWAAVALLGGYLVLRRRDV